MTIGHVVAGRFFGQNASQPNWWLQKWLLSQVVATLCLVNSSREEEKQGNHALLCQ